eukprot:scaffold9153_cov122-Isochrysis_galbana.AAC.4
MHEQPCRICDLTQPRPLRARDSASYLGQSFSKSPRRTCTQAITAGAERTLPFWSSSVTGEASSGAPPTPPPATSPIKLPELPLKWPVRPTFFAPAAPWPSRSLRAPSKAPRRGDAISG